MLAKTSFSVQLFANERHTSSQPTISLSSYFSSIFIFIIIIIWSSSSVVPTTTTYNHYLLF